MFVGAAAISMSEIELAVHPERHPVNTVVGINAAEPGQKGIPLIGLVVAVGVFKDKEVGAVANEDLTALVFAVFAPVLLDGDSHRDGPDLVGENRDFIRFAVAISVFQDLDFVGVGEPGEVFAAAMSRAVV